MNLDGIIIGLASFVIIGVFHPIVIKGEYYFGKKIWPVFLIAGLILIIFSMIINNSLISILMGVTAFTCFWSIPELFEQEKRVEKGWFPKNPAKKK
ncbi:DUF4491 family protein [Clostridium sp.]|jgi:membrane-associated PAP2 superfamily phosphatase|uniref:DUF4491 family protein n=1 Tax=Clostridium sp. TaxID=1506 RepID=UPI0039F493A6